MALRDRHGLPVSTTSRASLDAYEHAVELYLRYSGNPIAVLDEALARDPAFTLGHLAKAAIFAATTEKALEPEMRAAVDAAERLGASANDRERMHLAAARAWLDGDFERAVDRYGRIALEYPRDVLAVQTAHVGDFYLGQQAALRDRIAQVLHAWDDRVPGYGYLLGMYAFGLEETGDYSRAEAVGRRAVELDRRDAWASHAVAHVMEMQARIDEGIRWLSEESTQWDRDCAFAYHNFWHLALFLLDLGAVDAALAVYDRRIRPSESGVVLEMIDASALLWRLHLAGCDVGDRFARLADSWRPRIDDCHYVFNDVHALMAFLGAGRRDEARALLGAVERHAGDGDTNGRMIREVGLPVCRALLAFAEGDHARCVDLLLAARTTAVRFGGSNAQRDVLSLTLLEAALRAGRGNVARALASERTRLRPGNPGGWWASARALETSGDATGAATAREEAGRIRAQLAASLRTADRAAIVT